MGSPLNISYASFFRFMLQFLCLQMCVYGGSAVPQGGGGGPSLGDHPPGAGGGGVFPGVGNDKGRGRGYNDDNGCNCGSQGPQLLLAVSCEWVF